MSGYILTGKKLSSNYNANMDITFWSVCLTSGREGMRFGIYSWSADNLKRLLSHITVIVRLSIFIAKYNLSL